MRDRILNKATENPFASRICLLVLVILVNYLTQGLSYQYGLFNLPNLEIAYSLMISVKCIATFQMYNHFLQGLQFRKLGNTADVNWSIFFAGILLLFYILLGGLAANRSVDMDTRGLFIVLGLFVIGLMYSFALVIGNIERIENS